MCIQYQHGQHAGHVGIGKSVLSMPYFDRFNIVMFYSYVMKCVWIIFRKASHVNFCDLGQHANINAILITDNNGCTK